VKYGISRSTEKKGGRVGLDMKVKILCVAACFICICFVLVTTSPAAEVFGFNLGVQTLEQTKAFFKKKGIKYTEWVENGTPVLSIEKYDRFGKYGPLEEVRFVFTPDTKILFVFAASYADNKNTLKTFKDAFDAKYDFLKKITIGIETRYNYIDKKRTMQIYLEHNRTHVFPGLVRMGFEDIILRNKCEKYKEAKALAEKQANVKKMEGDL
jgi:hypothetical protein